jgi:thioredoxin reductase
MLDWLIVGGGIHGTHLSLVLTSVAGVPRDRVRVLDPHEAPLARWLECTENVGMSHLRSPYVHQIDSHPFSLRQFSRTAAGREAGALAGFYRRPALALFNAHARQVVADHGLDALRVHGRALRVEACPGGYRVETETGALETRRLLLAMGIGEQLYWPPWAAALRAAGAPVDHVFSPGWRRAALPPWTHAVVVGGGISAVQTALALSAAAPGTVTLLPRHPMRVVQFDSAPGWIGPRYQAAFHEERSWARRRTLVDRSRHRGSVPPEVASAFRAALVRGHLRLRTAVVSDAAVDGAGGVVLSCEDGTSLSADRVVLATGFEGRRPGSPWLDAVVDSVGLPCAPCGYPVVDAGLHWGAGIFVSGALAELELGPVARNVVGARLSGQRLAAAARA